MATGNTQIKVGIYMSVTPLQVSADPMRKCCNGRYSVSLCGGLNFSAAYFETMVVPLARRHSKKSETSRAKKLLFDSNHSTTSGMLFGDDRRLPFSARNPILNSFSILWLLIIPRPRLTLKPINAHSYLPLTIEPYLKRKPCRTILFSRLHQLEALTKK
jgi:hypothetical protein